MPLEAILDPKHDTSSVTASSCQPWFVKPLQEDGIHKYGEIHVTMEKRELGVSLLFSLAVINGLNHCTSL